MSFQKGEASRRPDWEHHQKQATKPHHRGFASAITTIFPPKVQQLSRQKRIITGASLLQPEAQKPATEATKPTGARIVSIVGASFEQSEAARRPDQQHHQKRAVCNQASNGHASSKVPWFGQPKTSSSGVSTSHQANMCVISGIVSAMG